MRPGTLHVEQQLRRLAARSTQEIVLRRGRHLGMYVGAGFPKSGTVWLCQLMGGYLGLPYPRDYQSPIAMASVIHAHWDWDKRLPPTVYIRRDARDVAVSLYFFLTRAAAMAKNPSRARRLQKMFTTLYGDNFDPTDIRYNLPRFLEHEFAHPRTPHGVPWGHHVQDWWDRPGVVHTSYEALLADTAGELARVMEQLTGQAADHDRALLTARRYEFTRTAGRQAGQEDRTSFLRKGIAGDWKNHFNQESAEILDAICGEALVEFGYVSDRTWWRGL